jgi:CheY-like chemotaxis protein
MDGWEAALVIRNLPRADAKTVPIVTISANAFPEDIEKSFASGMNDHYAKPIERAVLTEILGTHCTPTGQNMSGIGLNNSALRGYSTQRRW